MSKNIKNWIAGIMSLVYIAGGVWLFQHPNYFQSPTIAQCFSFALVAYAFFRIWRIYSVQKQVQA